MTVNRPSGIADLVEAVETLRPADDDTRREIARMLGFQWPSTDARTATPRRPSNARASQPGSRDVAVSGREATSFARPQSPDERLEAELDWSPAPAATAPAWLATVKQFRETESRHLRPLLPMQPLFDPKTSRAIVSSALATPAPVGGMDIAEVLAHICRAEAIMRIPQKAVPTLVRGVQVLVDRGEAMQPFAIDQSLLTSRIVNVVGRDRTSVLYFSGSPEWGAGVGAADDWLPYRPPAPGTPVLVLTDLGIGRPPDVIDRATPDDWSAFAALLARAGCPLVAFVPYASRRWPAVIRHRMTIVQWDRATTASTVRQAVGIGLEVAEELR